MKRDTISPKGGPAQAIPPKRKSAPIKRALGGLLVIALTVTLIGSAFFRPSLEGGLHLVPRFPLGAWVRDLPAQLWWVGLFALFSAAMAPLRAWRWGFTLPQPKPHYSDRYHSVALGLLGNNVIPGKLGEGLRALALSRFTEQRGQSQGIPFARSLGTILVCKLLDLLALLVLVSASPMGPLFRSSGSNGGFVGAVIAIPLLTAALFGVARWAPKAADSLQRRQKAPKFERLLRDLGVGVAASGSPLRLGLAFAATLVAISAVATGYTVALRGVGVEAGLLSGAFLLGAVTLGQSPPGVPAGMGMYYLSSSWAARLLGATPEQAATIAVLTHLTTVLSHLGVGAASLLIRKVRPRDFLPKKAAAQQS